jgi:transcriptional regulator with XRE-family HTH domain
MTESPFGNLLDTYRKQKKKKLTIEELGEKASVSPSYISLLIRGKKGRPSDGIIEQLAIALDLTEQEKSQLFHAAEQTAALFHDTRSPDAFRGMTPSAAGLIGVRDRLREELFRDHATQADELIRIQDIWLRDPMSYASVLREVLSTAKPNLKIQILLLDPNADNISEGRRKALGHASKEYIKAQINAAIYEFEAVRNILGRNCKQFEVRTFETVPSIQQIVCDEVTYIGFFLYGKVSQSTYQLEIHSASRLGELFKEEFETVWEVDGTKPVVPKPAKESTQTGH